MKYDEFYPTMLQFILSREGGYVNNTADKGGETNKGITNTTYNSYRKTKGLPLRSVKYMTNDELEEIYYKNYYLASGADKVNNPRLALYVFDTAVNMGISVAKDLLKRSNGNLKTFEKLRLEKYQKYVEYDNSQRIFLNGWKNRVSHTKDFAINVLPETRAPNFKVGIEMDVDEDGNVLYYYDIDDIRQMNFQELKDNFPKIYQQTKHKIFNNKIKQNNSTTPCAGTYHVKGYVRSDGVKVSDYYRTCGAKHMGKRSLLEQYAGLRFQDISSEEMNKVLKELI